MARSRRDDEPLFSGSEVPDEKTPGEGIAADAPPGASPETPAEEQVPTIAEESEEKALDTRVVVNGILHEVEQEMSSDRARQTLIGAVVLARAIIYGAGLIANAIRKN